jgi:hypothetical protein
VSKGDFERVFKLRAAKVILSPSKGDFCLYRKVQTERSLILKTKKQIGGLTAQDEAAEATKSPSKPVSTQ